MPGIARERYWFARHVAGYRRAAAAVAAHGPRGALRGPLLDAGCGEGYGAELLAGEVGPTATAGGEVGATATAGSEVGATATVGGEVAQVVGVDYAPDVVAHAAARYPHQQFAVAEVSALPFGPRALAAVVSSQVIEHLWDVGAWVRETARVLADAGVLVVLTPNRLTFTPGGGPPTNPFHATEFDPGELEAALAQHFTVVEVGGIGHGPRLAAIEQKHGVALPDAQTESAWQQWPGWLVQAVESTEPGDFAATAPAESLDLIAVAVRR